MNVISIAMKLKIKRHSSQNTIFTLKSNVLVSLYMIFPYYFGIMTCVRKCVPQSGTIYLLRISLKVSQCWEIVQNFRLRRARSARASPSTLNVIFLKFTDEQFQSRLLIVSIDVGRFQMNDRFLRIRKPIDHKCFMKQLF